jgi:hypothetical protein
LRGGQRHQLLRILGGGQLLGGDGGFFQRGLGSRQVQLDDLFHAFEGLGGQSVDQVQLGLQVGLGGGGQLILVRKHVYLL